MRRFFTWVFVVISLTLVVSAVGLAEQVELEVWFSDFNKNTQEWIAQDLVPAFEREHPNIKLNVVYVTWGEFNQKLKTQIAAGMSPDIFQGGSTFRGQAGAQGFGMNIDKYTKDWPDKQAFFPGAWDAVVWEGSDYGIPSLTAPRTIIYRSDLMAEGGFDPSTNPTDWDEVFAAAMKLSRVTGDGKPLRWGFNVLKANVDFWMSLTLQNGGQIVSHDGSQPLFATPEGEEAALWYYEFYQAQAAYGGALPAGGFANGAYVMEWANGKKVADTIIVNPQLEGDIRHGYPMKRKLQVAPTYTDSLFMAAETKHPDEAWEFLKFFGSAENLMKYNETLGYLPPRQDAMRSSFLAQYPHLKDTFERVMPYAVGRPTAASWAPVTAAINAIFTGSVTPQNAFLNAVAAWQTF